VCICWCVDYINYRGTRCNDEDIYLPLYFTKQHKNCYYVTKKFYLNCRMEVCYIFNNKMYFSIIFYVFVNKVIIFRIFFILSFRVSEI
jgi:hypothetical protein